MIRKIVIVLLLSLELFAVSQEGLVYKNRDTVIELIKNQEVGFSDLDPIYQNDRQIALLALDVDPYEFGNFKSEFKKDREMVKKAVSQDGYLLDEADSSLQKDPELLKLALESSGYGLEFSDEKDRDDKAFVLKVIDKNPFALEYVSQRLKGDEELVLRALSGILEGGECDEEPEEVNASKYIDKTLLYKKSFIIKLLNIAPYAESIVPEVLKEDKEIAALISSFSEELEDANLSGLSREEALRELNENPWVFPDLNKSFRNDKALVTIAIKYAPSFLEYVDESLKRDRAFMVELFHEDILLLEYMDDSFKNDKALLTPLVYDYPIILDYMGEELKKDNAFMLDIFQKTGEGFEYLNAKQKQDKTLIRKALENNEYNFLYVDEKLKDDKVFILELLAEFDIYDDISNRLKEDREVILASLKHISSSRLDSIPKVLLKDEAFIEEVIRRSGYGFKYATKEQQRNKELVREALKLYPAAFQYIDKSLREDRAFIMELLSEGSNVFPYIDESLKKDRAFVKSTIELDSMVFFDLNETQQEDREYIETAVKNNGWILDDLSNELKEDRKLIKLALAQNGWVLQIVPKPLNRDRELLLIALRENGLALEYVDEDLRKDRELVLTALRKNPAALTFVDNDLGKDKDFLISSINTPELFNYMDKTLLEDKDFMKKIKELKGFVPNTEQEDKPVVYRSSLVEVNASLAKEIKYKRYEDYKIHASSWNSAVDITDNQKYLISSSGSKINVWDVNSTLLFKQIDIHKDINDLALVDDGKSVLTLTSNEVAIWDLERGVVKKVLYRGDAHIWRMSLSSNRKWLVFFDENHMVRIYNLESGIKTQSFKVNTEGSLIFTIDNDAKYLAWGTYFRSNITLWEIHTSRKVATFEGDSSDLSALCFAPNNNYLVSADSDGYINIWDIKRKKLLRTLEGNQRNIKSLDISSDGKWLLSASYNIEVWNFKTGVYFKMFPISNKQRGYAKFINKNREILSYGHDNSIAIRDIASAKVRKEFKSLKRTAYLLKFSPDEKHMLMAFRGGDAHSKVAIWDIEKNRLLKVLESNSFQKVSALVMSQDSRYLFIAYGWGVGGGDNIYMEMWDMKKNKLLKRFKNMNDKAIDRENIFELVLSPDGKYLASYLNSGIEEYKGVELWSVESGERISFVPSFEKSSRSPFVILQDSRWLVVGDEKGKIKFWNIAQSRFMKSEQVSKESIDKITLFSKDKLLIASGKKIYLRSLKENRNIRVFNTKETPIHQIIALKNRDVFITESLSSRLNIWSLYQDKPLYSLELNHRYADIGLVIDLSSNGQKVIVGFDDGTAKLYSIDNLKEAEKIFVFGDRENWLVFDEVHKKMTLADKGDFLLKKEQVYKDKNVTVLTYKPLGL